MRTCSRTCRLPSTRHSRILLALPKPDHNTPPQMKTSETKSLLLLTLLAADDCSWPAGLETKADLSLVNKGKSRYSIVIASNAIPSERYAAEELQRYLEKMSGAKLPILTDARRAPARARSCWAIMPICGSWARKSTSKRSARTASRSAQTATGSSSPAANRAARLTAFTPFWKRNSASAGSPRNLNSCRRPIGFRSRP